MPIILKKDIVANAGRFGTFERVSGGGMTKNTTEHYEAGAQTPSLLEGVFNFKEITLERAYKPEIDGPAMQLSEAMMRGVQPNRVTIVVQRRNQLGIVIDQQQRTCKLIEADPPDGESGSGEAGMARYVFKVDEGIQ